MTSRLLITPGEPAGIGPDLVVQRAQLGDSDELVAIADPDLLAQRARKLGLPLTLRPIDLSLPPQPLAPGELAILPVSLAKASSPGKLDPGNAGYVLATLQTAIDACAAHQADALITGPVHKGVINQAGIPFSGHTEFLAHQTSTEEVVMMLATEELRVALVTTHLPLCKVPAAITAAKVERVTRILHHDLITQFGINNPRILVAGLNPHAGENGHMGREEIDHIEPALDRLRREGMQLIGPLPADTLFTPKYLEQADAVLAMYHDQGLPVLKYKGFGNAVNITLGLPIIRTSVDHGTALDLAGTGKADAGSLETALDYARKMVISKQRQQTLDRR